jgi:hypothetical protein
VSVVEHSLGQTNNYVVSDSAAVTHHKLGQHSSIATIYTYYHSAHIPTGELKRACWSRTTLSGTDRNWQAFQDRTALRWGEGGGKRIL